MFVNGYNRDGAYSHDVNLNMIISIRVEEDFSVGWVVKGVDETGFSHRLCRPQKSKGNAMLKKTAILTGFMKGEIE